MYNNILTYICFFVLCSLVVCDMWFFSSVVLQIICLILVCVVVSLVMFLAYKLHKGSYTTKEQQSNYQSVISHNVELTNELNNIKTKQVTTKQNSTELQQLILFNNRLTAQISNLQTRIEQLTEQLQNAKNQAKTVVLPITQNEQNQTASNNKKAKTA